MKKKDYWCFNFKNKTSRVSHQNFRILLYHHIWCVSAKITAKKIQLQEVEKANSTPNSISTDSVMDFPSDMEAVIDYLLPYCIPWTFCNKMMLYDGYMSNLVESFVHGDTTQCDTSQCYFTSTPPETLDWNRAYNDDPDTQLITSRLQTIAHSSWDEANLAKVNRAYRAPLRDRRIQRVNKNWFFSSLSSQISNTSC